MTKLQAILRDWFYSKMNWNEMCFWIDNHAALLCGKERHTMVGKQRKSEGSRNLPPFKLHKCGGKTDEWRACPIRESNEVKVNLVDEYWLRIWLEEWRSKGVKVRIRRVSARHCGDRNTTTVQARTAASSIFTFIHHNSFWLSMHQSCSKPWVMVNFSERCSILSASPI